MNNPLCNRVKKITLDGGNYSYTGFKGVLIVGIIALSMSTADSILNSSIGSCNKIQLYFADAVFVLDTKNVFVPLFAGILLCLPCLRTKKAYDKDFQLSKVRQLGPTLASFKGSVIFVPASNFGKMDGIIYPPKFCKLFPF